MKSPIILFVLLLAGCAKKGEVTIHGDVVDKYTGTPLPQAHGAYVSAYDLTKAAGRFANGYVDANGHYSISGNYEIGSEAKLICQLNPVGSSVALSYLDTYSSELIKVGENTIHNINVSCVSYLNRRIVNTSGTTYDSLILTYKNIERTVNEKYLLYSAQFLNPVVLLPVGNNIITMQFFKSGLPTVYSDTLSTPCFHTLTDTIAY